MTCFFSLNTYYKNSQQCHVKKRKAICAKNKLQELCYPQVCCMCVCVCICMAFCRHGYAVASDAKTYKFGLFLFCRVATGFRGNALWAEPHNMASGFFRCSVAVARLFLHRLLLFQHCFNRQEQFCITSGWNREHFICNGSEQFTSLFLSIMWTKLASNTRHQEEHSPVV